MDPNLPRRRTSSPPPDTFQPGNNIIAPDITHQRSGTPTDPYFRGGTERGDVFPTGYYNQQATYQSVGAYGAPTQHHIQPPAASQRAYTPQQFSQHPTPTGTPFAYPGHGLSHPRQYTDHRQLPQIHDLPSRHGPAQQQSFHQGNRPAYNVAGNPNAAQIRQVTFPPASTGQLPQQVVYAQTAQPEAETSHRGVKRGADAGPGQDGEEEIDQLPLETAEGTAKGKEQASSVASKADVAKADNGGKAGNNPAQKKPRKSKTSDEEIEVLGTDLRKTADVASTEDNKSGGAWSDKDTLTMVQIVCDPAKWDSFKINQANVFKDIGANRLSVKRTKESVKNKWEYVYRFYKAVRQWESITGGKDGDGNFEFTFPVDDDEVEKKEDDAADTLAAEGAPPAAASKADSDQPPAAKASASTSASKKTGKAKATPKTTTVTEEKLQKFKDGPLYPVIHKVAQDNPEVIRAKVVNSASRVDGTEDTGKAKRKKKGKKDKDHADSDTELQAGILDSLKFKANVAQQQLDLAKEKVKVELAREERDRLTWEAEEKRKMDEARTKKWEQAAKWAEHTDPRIRKKADAMIAELEKEEAGEEEPHE